MIKNDLVCVYSDLEEIYNFTFADCNPHNLFKVLVSAEKRINELLYTKNLGLTFDIIPSYHSFQAISPEMKILIIRKSIEEKMKEIEAMIDAIDYGNNDLKPFPVWIANYGIDCSGYQDREYSEFQREFEKFEDKNGFIYFQFSKNPNKTS